MRGASPPKRAEPGGGGVLSIFVLRGCAVFQGIVFAYFF